VIGGNFSDVSGMDNAVAFLAKDPATNDELLDIEH
jgi:hypothetical protein